MKFSLTFLARALTLTAAALVGCGAAVAQSAEPLVIYNAQHDDLTAGWVQAFTRETGIKVVVRNGGDAELGNQLLQEGKASPADVFLTENSPSIAMVDSAGLLAPLNADTLAQVPANFRPDRKSVV